MCCNRINEIEPLMTISSLKLLIKYYKKIFKTDLHFKYLLKTLNIVVLTLCYLKHVRIKSIINIYKYEKKQ